MKPVCMALIVLLIAAGLLDVSVGASPASYTLYEDSVSGWGLSSSSMTRPGPDLVAAPGEMVSLSLVATDVIFPHDFGVDYNDNGVPDEETEPHSPLFGGSGNPNPLYYSFTADTSVGVYKYFCYIHRDTSFGRFIVGSPAIIHDVAVNQVTTSTSQVGLGGTPLIIVTVTNQGDALEGFDVTTYYDATSIGVQNVQDLWLDRSTTLYFSWSTASVAPGTYTIRAVSNSVVGETNTANNELSDGTITVLSSADTTAPTWPVGRSLSALGITTDSLNLSWSDATDNVGVSGYKVYKDGVGAGNLVGDTRSHVVTGLTSGTEFVFKVEAGDASENWSNDGPSLTVRTQSPPSQNPASGQSFWQEYWYIPPSVVAAVVALALAVLRVTRRNAGKPAVPDR